MIRLLGKKLAVSAGAAAMVFGALQPAQAAGVGAAPAKAPSAPPATSSGALSITTPTLSISVAPTPGQGSAAIAVRTSTLAIDVAGTNATASAIGVTTPELRVALSGTGQSDSASTAISVRTATLAIGVAATVGAAQPHQQGPITVTTPALNIRVAQK